MQIYNYHPNTGEFLKESTASIDPLESKLAGTPIYMLPAFATFIKPPDFTENEVPVWISGAWALKPDFRGTKYYIGSDKIVIKEIGETVPAGTTLDPPPENFANPFYDGYKWTDLGIPPIPDNERIVGITAATIGHLKQATTFSEFIAIFKAEVDA